MGGKIGGFIKKIGGMALSAASMFTPAGGIFKMAQGLFSIGSKIAGALKPLAPKVFQALDTKLGGLQNLAFKAFGKASDFLKKVGGQAIQAGTQMAANPPQANPVIASLGIRLPAWLQ